jgi:hypothetical protein
VLEPVEKWVGQSTVSWKGEKRGMMGRVRGSSTFFSCMEAMLGVCMFPETKNLAFYTIA